MNKYGTVKLGDLNVSKVAKMRLVYTQTGTSYYASPESQTPNPLLHIETLSILIFKFISITL